MGAESLYTCGGLRGMIGQQVAARGELTAPSRVRAFITELCVCSWRKGMQLVVPTFLCALCMSLVSSGSSHGYQDHSADRYPDGLCSAATP